MTTHRRLKFQQIKSDFKKCKELKNFRILEIGTKTLKFTRAFKEIIVTMARLQNILLLVLLVTPMIIQITSPGKHTLRIFVQVKRKVTFNIIFDIILKCIFD